MWGTVLTEEPTASGRKRSVLSQRKERNKVLGREKAGRAWCVCVRLKAALLVRCVILSQPHSTKSGMKPYVLVATR